VAAAIDRALSMPLDERQARHRQMMSALAENDIKDWGSRFIEALTAPTGGTAWPWQVSA
jgi:trehalose 6-phosphate synthase